MKSLRYLSLFLISAYIPSAQAQLSNYIYGITNPSAGQFYFAQINPATNGLTNLQLLPVSSIQSSFGSCVNTHTSQFYFNTGSSLMIINPVNGSIISNNTYPVAAGIKVWYMQYNTCDSMLYGVCNNYPAPNTLIKYNPTTNAITTIGPLNSLTGFTLGGQALIHSNGLLYMVPPKSFDITTGALVSGPGITNIPNESFGHTSFYCANSEVYGTSANVSAGIKYLATLDMQTGLVQHVADTGWTIGISKPVYGGNCIDQNTGTYYYIGAGGLLIGANISNGTMTYSHAFSSDNPMFIQHFSQCVCDPFSSVTEEEPGIINVWPNPSQISFTLSVKENIPFAFTIFNSLGEIISDGSFIRQTEISNENWPTGMYLVQLSNGRQLFTVKIIKQ